MLLSSAVREDGKIRALPRFAASIPAALHDHGDVAFPALTYFDILAVADLDSAG